MEMTDRQISLPALCAGIEAHDGFYVPSLQPESCLHRQHKSILWATPPLLLASLASRMGRGWLERMRWAEI